MVSKVYSFGVIGIEAYSVEIEVDITTGMPKVNLVGLTDTVIKESKERIKSAIKNSGFKWPGERITINLSPSDIKKEGTGFDLPIALGILSASEQINAENLKDYCILGELSLDGSLRPAHGILPISIALPKYGNKKLILPFMNAREAAIVNTTQAFPLKTLSQTVEFLNNPSLKGPFVLNIAELFKRHLPYPVDFSEVKGQYRAKRAVEVAVAGGHNLLIM
jgi:magnesium chelatase family protein